MKLGVVLRAAGAAVIVALPQPLSGRKRASRFLAARCFSSCVYALMGGVARVVPRGSRIGVHRMHRTMVGEDAPGRARKPTLEYASQPQVDALRRYAADMGIEPGLIALAERFSPSELHLLSRRDMRRFQLAREGL